MKYNAETKELFTDKGVFLKKMQCHEDVEWKKMEKGKNDLVKICNLCKKEVISTECLSDDEIKFILEKDSNTCLYIKTTM
jgi:hypothetical protein